MLKWLRGRKTYLTAIAGVITGVVLIVDGHVVEGVQTILGSLGLGFLRAGVSKTD